MRNMFEGAKSFCQDISAWDITSISSSFGMSDMLDSTAISTNYYDAIFWNTPNPFKTQTVFKLNDLAEGQKIEIYTAVGQKITTLHKLLGLNTITWNTENFSNGVYFAKLIINNQQAGLKKLVLMK